MSGWNWNNLNSLNKNNLQFNSSQFNSSQFNSSQFSNSYDKTTHMEFEDTEIIDANLVNTEKFNQINIKLNEIKNELDILKYKQTTKHIIHLGVNCSNCKKKNIIGIRYKCFHCQEYNVCEDCERYLNSFHDNSHFFIRIHDTSLYNNIVKQQQRYNQEQQQQRYNQ